MTARPRRSEHAQHGGDDDVELVVVDDVAASGTLTSSDTWEYVAQ